MKISSYTKDELLGQIQGLMDSGQGDIGRSRYILMTLRKGSTLYRSDQKYLNEKLDKINKKTEPKKISKKTLRN